jgi:hypothetical protein
MEAQIASAVIDAATKLPSYLRRNPNPDRTPNLHRAESHLSPAAGTKEI